MKIILLFALFLSSAISVQAQSDKIPVSELPQKAKVFLSQHYKHRPVASCRKKNGSPAYEVRLAQGTAICFSANGDWCQVDGDGSSLPKKMLPEKVASYIDANFPKKRVLYIEKDANGFEVNLNGDIGLAFDSRGQFVQ